MRSLSITRTRTRKIMWFRFMMLSFLLTVLSSNASRSQTVAFGWPEAKKAAISLTFDDARASQVTGGTDLLDSYGTKATFYVLPSELTAQLAGWKKAVVNGHEIGNHSSTHPCSGNLPWSKDNAIENSTLVEMRKELVDANKAIEDLLGVKPQAFAYPCGQTFIGRGVNTKSYVPLVAEVFLTGRGWKDESPNDPGFCDFAQLTGMEMDGKDFEEILPILKSAILNNQWVVLAGHEMGESGDQTTRLSMLKKLIEYANDPANQLWIAPVGTVAGYIRQHRK